MAGLSSGSCIALVAGSGIRLEDVLDSIDSTTPFHDVPGLCSPTAPGHPGRFVRGQCGGVPIIVQAGRLHCYEGHSIAAAVRTVDVLAEWGARTIAFTHAVGGLLPSLAEGSLISATGYRCWAYRGWPDGPETVPIDEGIAGCDGTGEVLWVHGPCYETRAEIRAMQALGVCAVGMSTAPEVARCRQLGLRAGAVALVTNSCCGTSAPLTHAHVTAQAERASERLCGVLRGWVETKGSGVLSSLEKKKVPKKKR